ncbi:peptidase inhibitor family I36 protein [Streptomyces cinnamoneus]|uniref:peptidase inhibitor family I36 protein n=1 Tax=Streptomyces cinnamoneus TaxID=53446 RepID=UPI003424E1CC
MSMTASRLVATLTTMACALALPAANAIGSPAPARSRAVSAAAENCPEDTFCVRDTQGHYAHYRAGSNDVRAQGLKGGAVWAWNRTQSTWCIWNQPGRSGDDAKVRAGQQGPTGMTFFALKPAVQGICW